eukprot:1157214-Pelagomonas_calceolata.AAC.7
MHVQRLDAQISMVSFCGLLDGRGAGFVWHEFNSSFEPHCVCACVRVHVKSWFLQTSFGLCNLASLPTAAASRRAGTPVRAVSPRCATAKWHRTRRAGTLVRAVSAGCATAKWHRTRWAGTLVRAVSPRCATAKWHRTRWAGTPEPIRDQRGALSP